MAKTPLTGSRIRDLRTDRGLRQAALAKACDISPSYLNLIEHNRRRIGGGLLVKIADALDVDASVLSSGAGEVLAAAVDAAAEAHPDTGAERARVEEFAGRFPGWARLIDKQSRDLRRLEQIVEQLGDRLTHDPFLSASMHNVLSSVTAIRSASAILAQGGDIEPEWQDRFHRNIYEDSQRLAEATETLVEYLDSDDKQDGKVTLPQDEVDAWMAATGWRIEPLEQDPDTDPERIIKAASPLVSVAARRLAKRLILRYAGDARAVPLTDLQAAIATHGLDPSALAHRFQTDLPRLFRRLIALGPDGLPKGESADFGLVACDASGTLTFRKSPQGFDMPRYGSACPLWPLFQALGRPMVPVVQTVTMAGRDEASFETMAISTMSYPQGFDGPAVVEAWMLIQPILRLPETSRSQRVGSSCSVCSELECVARREPSVFAFDDDARPLTP